MFYYNTNSCFHKQVFPIIKKYSDHMIKTNYKGFFKLQRNDTNNHKALKNRIFVSFLNYGFNIYTKFSKMNYFKRTNALYRNRNYNFYEVLGVERNSTNEEIKSAYLRLAKQYHPDVNKDPGSDDKFKNIALAYEALSNQRNRDLYDAYMENDPYMNEWDFWKEEDKFSKQDRARQDKKASGFYKNARESNFWRGEREDFEEKFYKDYENIFSSGFKESKPQKGEDILVFFLILS